jgi:hypothetical protein
MAFPHVSVSWVPPKYFQVLDIGRAFITFGKQFFDNINGIVNRINNAVLVTVGSFIFGTGLQPKFQVGFALWYF